MLIAREIMDSLQEMFGQASYQIKHVFLKYIYNVHMNEGASVREYVLNMMVHFNEVEMNEVVIDEASQTFESLMKIKRQKGETNVATSTRKFHRDSTSGTKFVPSYGIKKWKKKKGGQGNKANPAATKTSRKAKATKGIYFHCNQEGH
ncbi:gag/pol protein [Cucumis melo var. makuwa]|uniref:Gag/pol protein n=1 Tax=Cucumis melo var. makuwa TaxID=1194695 RepID=A0A5A7TFX0_CUCMM|nr:gag/pol protein [Cucumis melo var. makuwa]TYK28860.1 gag/pol protein [Cucumis melo var. makuwa]